LRTILPSMCMQIVINTIQGTFIVPPEKESSLIMWLQQNAIKVGQQPVHEQQGHGSYTGRQLINEDSGRKF
jgi:hypothetical protein